MRELSARERLLLIIVACAAVATVFYLFVWAPKTTERANLTRELDKQQIELKRLRELAATREQKEREYAELADRIKLVEARLPAQREIPDLIRSLQDVAADLGVKLMLMRPGPTQAPPGAAAPGAPAQPVKGQAPAQQQPATLRYQQFRVDLAYEGTYEKLIAYLSRLEDFPRFIVLTQVSMTPGELPRLKATLSTNTFVLPREGDRPK